uniref:Glutaredoxin n=1 Tax=Dichotomaria marginata TaxID=268567 RepID=A0A1G4NS85_9FLOR|nr:Hypothetical protein ORF_19 [Dichotomaria marginata]SCW21494.1 Hypothetical protein ORF_19 [Dichotomaria marginata]
MEYIILERIESLINNHDIIIFMKGRKENPKCGFSNNVIQIFNSFNLEYNTYDVLEDENIRTGIKTYSQWPTIPQVYIKGKFIGGSDIIIELYKNKQLHELLESLLNE